MERQTSEKIHIFASLNPYISNVRQPTLTKFSTLVEFPWCAFSRQSTTG